MLGYHSDVVGALAGEEEGGSKADNASADDYDVLTG